MSEQDITDPRQVTAVRNCGLDISPIARSHEIDGFPVLKVTDGSLTCLSFYGGEDENCGLVDNAENGVTIGTSDTEVGVAECLINCIFGDACHTNVTPRS